MIITTTNQINGQNISIIGIVEGATVQTKHVGRDFMAGLKNLVGGELKGYTEMMNEARSIAKQRMIAQAQSMGADAVVGFRYVSSEVAQSAAEVVAYGTAVKFV